MERDTFFGRRNERPAERQEKSSGIGHGTAAAQVPSALSSAPTASEDVRSVVKDTTVIPAPQSEEQQGARLLVGQNIKLKGVEITDCDTLIVEGHVEATMDSRMIQITPSGTFSGTAGIDVAEIHGGFSGELTVRKCLTVHKSGKVSGKIRYGKVVIEEGGEISGDVQKLPDDDKSAGVQQKPGGNKATGLAQPAGAHS